MRKEIAELLATGKEDSARIRVEGIIRETNMLAAFEILELFCELLNVRMALIVQTKGVLEECREAISSVIFATQRLPDLPELLAVRGQFLSKFGKEYIMACTQEDTCLDQGVNRGLYNSLSVETPSGVKKLKVLSEIAAEYGVNWDADEAAERILSSTLMTSGPGSLGQAPEALTGNQLETSSGASSEEEAEEEEEVEAVMASVLGIPAAVQPGAQAPGPGPAAAPGPGEPGEYKTAAEAAAAATAAAATAQRAAAAAVALSAREDGAAAADLPPEVTTILTGLDAAPAAPSAPPLAPPSGPPEEDFDELTKRFEDLKRRK